MRFDLTRPALVTCALLLGSGCFRLTAGDKTREEFQPPRRIDPAAIALPTGYRIEPIATGLTYPTSVTFDAQGTPYVTEAGYAYGEDFTEPRLLRINPDGSHTVVATGAQPPWTGVVSNKDEGNGGPASHLGTGGLERPISVRFSPDNGALYVVDFGVMTVHRQGHPAPSRTRACCGASPPPPKKEAP